VLDAHPHLRLLLNDVLCALKTRVSEYGEWFGDADGAVSLKDEALRALRGHMTVEHPLDTFSHRAFTSARLLSPSSVAAYHSAYGEYMDQREDYLRIEV